MAGLRPHPSSSKTNRKNNTRMSKSLGKRVWGWAKRGVFTLFLCFIATSLMSGRFEGWRQEGITWWIDATRRAGLDIRNIILDGHHHTTKNDVTKVLENPV